MEKLNNKNPASVEEEYINTGSEEHIVCSDENLMKYMVEVTEILIESIWRSSQIMQQSLCPLNEYLNHVIRQSKISLYTLKCSIIYFVRMSRQLQDKRWRNKVRLFCGRRMFLGSVIIASKYLYDKTYSNSVWAKILSLDIKEVNNIQMDFLDALNYDLYVSEELDSIWSQMLENFIVYLKARHEEEEEEAKEAKEKPELNSISSTVDQSMPFPTPRCSPKDLKKSSNIIYTDYPNTPVSPENYYSSSTSFRSLSDDNNGNDGDKNEMKFSKNPIISKYSELMSTCSFYRKKQYLYQHQKLNNNNNDNDKKKTKLNFFRYHFNKIFPNHHLMNAMSSYTHSSGYYSDSTINHPSTFHLYKKRVDYRSIREANDRLNQEYHQQYPLLENVKLQNPSFEFSNNDENINDYNGHETKESIFSVISSNEENSLDDDDDDSSTLIESSSDEEDSDLDSDITRTTAKMNKNFFGMMEPSYWTSEQQGVYITTENYRN
ncbi:hypothetical protein H8356DRAFT_1306622 [Neocallimastix lanati (nom. inval.)]|nr:hypothetical protein H8356DRAFT_1306622 [Neocallimastix sp. JGI-2020a]